MPRETLYCRERLRLDGRREVGLSLPSAIALRSSSKSQR